MKIKEETFTSLTELAISKLGVLPRYLMNNGQLQFLLLECLGSLKAVFGVYHSPS